MQVKRRIVRVDYLSVTRKRAWGSPFEKQDRYDDTYISMDEARGNSAVDYEGAVKKAIAKAFKGIDTFGEMKIISIDGLVPRKYSAKSYNAGQVRLGYARAIVEFQKRRQGAPRWAEISVHTDENGAWQSPSVMTVEGRALLIDQAIFDDWFSGSDGWRKG